MKLMTDWCCAANDSMFLLPSRSVSPNAYCAPLVENKMRASANVIHPRSPGGNADKERASAASVVPSSFMASGGAATSAPNSFRIRLMITILGSLLQRGHHRTHASQQRAFSFEHQIVSPVQASNAGGGVRLFRSPLSLRS